MIPVVGTAWKVGLFPIWALWLGYKGLWWAIKPVEAASNAEGPEARSTLIPPRGALMGSFLGAMGSSIATALGLEWLARTGRMSSEHALWLWAWGTLAVTLAGLLAVRLSSRPVRRVGDRVKASLARVREKAGHVGDASKHAVQSAVEAAKAGWRPQPAPVAASPAADGVAPVNIQSRPAPDRVAGSVGKVVGGAARCAWNAGAKAAGGGRRAVGHGFVRVGRAIGG